MIKTDLRSYGLKGIGILAHFRSGSSSLHLNLKEHWLIQSCVSEPFHYENEFLRPLKESNPNWKLALNEKLALDYLKKFDQFKHMIGQPFSDMIIEGCQNEFDFVVLYRRNLLKVALSWHLASTTKVWGTRNPEDYASRISGMKVELKDIESALFRAEKQRKILKSIDVAKIHLVYEDLYEVNDEQKHQKMDEVFKALNYPLLKSPIYDRLSIKAKQNSPETYMLLKNVYELEREFGKEYGSLFE